MRLFLLPISTRRTLLYCEPPSRTLPTTQQSYSERAIAKANETWASWEQDTSSVLSWKKRTTAWGNMMFRRIPFEEWGLKSMPPLKKAQAREEGLSGAAAREGRRVEVQFPGLYQGLCKDSVNQTLRSLATERQALHKGRMLWSIGVMPLTMPFALVPLIPNLPFFYMVFRAYSHWRALSGSKHLEHLLNTSVLHPRPSATLDNLYTAGLLNPNRNSTRNADIPTREQSRAVADRLRAQTHGGQEDIMLLHGWNGKLLAEKLGLPGLQVEVERAVEQVQVGLNKDKAELQSEKKEVEDLKTASSVSPATQKTKVK